MGRKLSKWSIICGLVMITTFFLTACSEQAQKGDKPITEEVKKEKTPDINDRHLHDKDSLYEQKKPDIVTMYLTVRRGNTAENTDHSWKEINQYSAYDYEKMGVKRYQVAGLLQVGNEDGPMMGELGYGEVVPNSTVQIRGQSSSRSSQKSYKINIKKNKGNWEGQRTINLNKHPYEYLRFRNKLAFGLMESVPQIVGLRTQLVHLYVKDETGNNSKNFEDYGLYTQVEQWNKTALETHGLDKGGQLYKVNNFEFYREEDAIRKEEDPKFNKEEFEKRLEIKGDHDHTKLINMLEKLNKSSTTGDELLEDYFDAENIQYWMAFQILTGNVDSQNRNMFLYSPQNATRWYILPWDLDDSLRKNERSIRKAGGLGVNNWQYGVSNYWGNVLFQRLLKSDKFRKGLDTAVNDLYRNQLSPKRVEELSKKYAGLVRPYLERMPDMEHARVDKTLYDQLVKALPSDVEKNYQDYQESLQSPQPFYIDQPKIENKKLKLAWMASYDFEGRDVTYSVELAKDANFKEKIFEKKDMKETHIETDSLPKGQYFIRVIATNSEGKSKAAFDHYRTDSARLYGVLSFYIMEDGKVKVDTHVKE